MYATNYSRRSLLFFATLVVVIIGSLTLAERSSATGWTTEYYRNVCGADIARISAEPLGYQSGVPAEFLTTLTGNTTGSATPAETQRSCDTGDGKTAPAAGVEVKWNVSSGPNTGTSGGGITDDNGQYRFGFLNNAGTCGVDIVDFSIKKVFSWVTRDATTGEVISSGTSPITFWYAMPGAAHVTWTGCPGTTIVTERTAVHSATLKVARQCVRDFMLVRGSSNGPVSSATVYVDGKRVYKTTKQSFSFKVRSSKLSKRKKVHQVKVVTVYPDGARVTTKKRFRACARLTARGKRSPAFTG